MNGVLIDLAEIDSIKQHWKHSFACTSTVCDITDAALDDLDHDVSGICHVISTLTKLAFPPGGDTERIRSRVIINGKTHELKLHIGPGDTAEPVLTLMPPYEC